MRCKHCHGDGVEPKAFEEVIEDRDSVGNRAEESPWSVEDEVEAYLAAVKAQDEAFLGQTDGDDEEDDDDSWNGQLVDGPFYVNHLEALVYHYPDKSFDTYDDPYRYYVTETGDHVLEFGDDEVGVVIASGWRRIERFARYGEKPFNIE